MTVDEMTIDDAINVANVIGDCLPTDADSDLRELALAARRLVREVQEQAGELERERARRRSAFRREVPLSDGAPLEGRIDAGGWREFLAGRPVHAGDALYLLTVLGWYPVRYETNVPRKQSFLYLSLPGVHEEICISAPTEARLAWPDQLK